MRRAAIAMGMALATVSSQAGADEPQATEEVAVAKNTTEFVGRLGIVGAYRRLYDLDILGMGPQLSLGFERDGATVLFNLRFIDARTGAGLVVYETTGDFSVEGKLAEGWRAGVGIGTTFLSVTRATSGGPLQSLGPMFLGRITWDVGPLPNVYVGAELEVQWQASGAFPWGPTVEAGLRF
jgi:hypothetical protein